MVTQPMRRSLGRESAVLFVPTFSIADEKEE